MYTQPNEVARKKGTRTRNSKESGNHKDRAVGVVVGKGKNALRLVHTVT